MSTFNRGSWLITISALACLAVLTAAPAAGETLYNGIVTPTPWPPQMTNLNYCYPEPNTPYYLSSPPSVIPIDVGRQLLVDDFLIASTTLTRSHHQPDYYSGNPILSPVSASYEGHTSMPFSDGIWYDPNDHKFKMWYDGKNTYTLMAQSDDAIQWSRPGLGHPYDPNSNIVGPSPIITTRDSGMAWLDLSTGTDPNYRYRFTYYRNGVHNLRSSNGVLHYLTIPGDNGWDAYGHPKNTAWDRSTFFYNPFRNKWAFSCRNNSYVRAGGVRARLYWETNDWSAKMPTDYSNMWWLVADLQDLADPRYDKLTELYNLDAAPYESLMLGFFSIWHGDCHLYPSGDPDIDADKANDRPKLNAVKIGYSRDGWYWHRPDRRQWLPYNETVGAWNYGNVQSAGGGCLVMGDTLYIYCSGRNCQNEGPSAGEGEFGGMAFLRRDGFASMDAGGTEGSLTTRVMTFDGRCLFVNVDCPGGELKAEVLDANSNVISPFTKANCQVVATDSTCYRVSWSGASDLSSVSGDQVRLKFYLTNGSLYSFWVSADETGASAGYVAAGGPGHTTNKDTAGKAAYAAAYIAGQVDAGPSRQVTLPTAASLDGTVSNTGLPAGHSWSPDWSVTSGPGTVTFGDPNAADTTATFSAAGTYILRLTIDDGWMVAWDEMNVTATSSGGNVAPTVGAGSNQQITLPATASLDGTVSDDGLPNPPAATTATWSKSSGPGTVTFANANAVDTTATFSTAGTYILRLTASDSQLVNYDEVAITVSASNVAPSVSAGADAQISLPTNTRSLDGTVTDDGLPAPPGATTVSWTKQSGTGTVTFTSSTSVDTTATFSTSGTYVLRLTANDSALTAYDECSITVNPAGNAAPSVNAGPNQQITLPGTSTLDGTVSDDGLPSPPGTTTASWTKQSGAGTVTFASSTSVDTTATYSTAGTYVLRLTASDSALSSYDELNITVNPQTGGGGDEFHVTPTGSPSGDGSQSSPWDLKTALEQPAAVGPGDTIWVHGGDYVQTMLRSDLAGTASQPIVLRAVTGERASIHSDLMMPGAPWGDPQYVWIWGLEFANRGWDANADNGISISGSDPNYGAPGVKIINCVVHDNNTVGIASWALADDQETYGNIVYNNGYDVPGDSRGHGHGMYIQSQTGPKLFKNNIIFRNFDKGAQLYSQTMGLNNVTFQDNTLFNNSELSIYCNGENCDNLAFQGLVQSHGTRMLGNMSYAPTWATVCVNVYGDGTNGEVSNNYFVAHHGDPAICWQINTPVDGLVMNNNTFFGRIQGFTLNQYGTGNIQLVSEPASATVFVKPNAYESGRAHITIYNWTDANSVSVDISSVGVPNGTAYEVRDAQNFYGGAVASGTYNGSPISIPMTGLTVAAPQGLDPNTYPTPDHTAPAFGAFVLLASGGTPVNMAPTVDAGLNQQITWPTSTVSLNGSVSDDGLPNPPAATTKTWSKQSGAGTVTFANASTEDTTATFSTTGTYVLRLTANDSALTAQDECSVTVSGVANQDPNVGAGSDQSITLPTSSVSLDGTVTDDGLPNPPATVTTTWTKASGPGLVTFANYLAIDTTATFSTAGTYVLRLTASDSSLQAYDECSVTVNPQSGGADFVMRLQLDENTGTVAYDSSGNGHNGTLINGPTWVTGKSGSAVHLDETNDYMKVLDFTYGPEFSLIFWFKLDDNAGASMQYIYCHGSAASLNTLVIYLNEAGVSPANRLYTLLRDSNDSAASVLDFTLTIDPNWHMYSLTVKSGEGCKVYIDANQVASDPNRGGDSLNPNDAIYLGTRWDLSSSRFFGGSMDDVRFYNRALTAAEVSSLAGAPSNQAPAVDAGTTQSIMLPTNTASLDGTVSDDGLPSGNLTQTWSKQSGAGTVTFANANAVDTTATFSTVGTYVLRLTATDTALSTYDEVLVTVRQNAAPTVNAGSNQSITLPNYAVLDGTVSDDGLPLPPGYTTSTWSKTSGAGTVTFGAANDVDTTATFSTNGTYVLRLTASDSALSTYDELTITVGAQNAAPVVSAGNNQTIVLPGTASLDGTVTDDGLPNPPATVTQTWSKQSGAGTVTFANANAVDTTATFSTAGTYVLRLTASDSALTSYNEATITVRQNVAPTVSAGNDASITLPTSTVSLDGTVSDDGLPGGGLTQTWSKQSGAGTVTFANANAVDTTATFSTSGTYVLRLTASDTALTAYDEVSITVNPDAGMPSPLMKLLMDDGSGTVASDASGNNHPATLFNGPTWVTGHQGSGYAVDMDETNDYMRITDFNYGPEFTWSFWFKLDDNTGTTDQYLLDHNGWDSANSVTVIVREASSQTDPNKVTTCVRDGNDSSGMNVMFNAPTDGNWHLYTLTVETGVGCKVYLDANEVGSNASHGGDAINPAYNIYLASRWDASSSRLLGGSMDDVRVYNDALTESQVNTLFGE